jgi:aminoglycoside phosphotransferase family enzyme/predicted kinase
MPSVTPTLDRSAILRDLVPEGTTLVETHISWVLVGPDEVWKLKKPVSMGFLDFGTLARRKAACEAEVTLNRRLAPHVYLGVRPVRRDAAGRLFIDGQREGEREREGHGEDAAARAGELDEDVTAREAQGDREAELVDWAVHMRRLPDRDRADVRLAEGRLHRDHLDRIARRLADFHAQARCDEVTSAFGRPEAIAVNVRENFDQTRESIERFLAPPQAHEIERAQLGFLDEHPDLFAARIAAGRVRDGHGDLRLEHVYLAEDGGLSDDDGAVTIIDCIEFNDRFRYADVAADLAFLAMELSEHGHVELSEHLVARYAQHAGDHDLYAVLDFYEGYRAYVRGKIATFVATGPGVDHDRRERAEASARHHFLLALAADRSLLLGPMVVAVAGIIASGKSTVADQLSFEMSAPVVDADHTRKQLLGVHATEPVHDGVWQGAYDPAFTEAVYAEVFRRAAVVLASGRPVIVEASFRSRALRARARELATRHRVPFRLVECRASPEVCRARLRERAKRASVSDGRLEIFDDFVARWQPIDELPAEEHLVLDTEGPLAESLVALRDALRTWPPGL